MRRLLTALLLVVAAGAAVVVAGLVLPRTRHTSHTFEAPLHRVVVHVATGKVVVVANRVLGARVSDERRFAVRQPRVVTRIDSGVLRVDASCPKPTILACRVDVHLDITPEMAVDVTTGSGDIRVDSIAGAVTARSTTGAVEVVGLTGTADLHTAAGPISGRDLAVSRLRAVTAAGAVELRFAVAPDSVTATTGAGNVDLAVPDDTYRVTTSAPVGQSRVFVPLDRESSRTITVRSAAGRVTVRRAPPT
jgi:hypothetical protein